MYKVSMEEQEFIGEVGKIVPSVDFSATTTSKSITLKITTKRSQGGTVECYIKGENDSNYGTAQKATDNQYTFTVFPNFFNSSLFSAFPLAISNISESVLS